MENILSCKKLSLPNFINFSFFLLRMLLAQKLAKAVSKPSRCDYAPLRVKLIWKLKNVEEIFDR